MITGKKMRRRAGKVIGLLICLAIQFTVSQCCAQERYFSEDYMITSSVVSGVGCPAASESYRITVCSGGQPNAIGFSWNGPFRNFAGFIYTLGSDEFLDIIPEDFDPFFGNPDFTIQVLPKEAFVIHPGSPMKGSLLLAGNYGETATYTVNIFSAYGFTDLVYLSVCNLCCSLLTCFDPNPVTPPQAGKASSTLMMKASASTDVGSYPLIVLGMDKTGMLHHTDEIKLHVIDKPDFSLSINPDPAVVSQRGAILVRNTIMSLFGFNETVTLSAVGVPDGVAAGFFPNPVTPLPNEAIVSIFTMNSSMAADPGLYTVTIVGNAEDNLTHSKDFVFAIDESQAMPKITMRIEPAVVIKKPDSSFTVCLSTDDLSGLYVNTFYGEISYNTGVMTFDSTINFHNTCLDSLGWDLKWHYKGGTPGTIQFWLIGGGDASGGIECGGCLLNLGFHINSSASPGNEGFISIVEAIFDEGSLTTTTEKGIVIVNRPPRITSSLPETLYFSEEFYEDCIEIIAMDADNDSIMLWSDLDPDSCDGVGEDTVLGLGSVKMDFCWRPPKHGTCDTLDIDFIAKSTHTTGQPLYDVLSTTIIVRDCEIMLAWPDTAWHAGGWLEIPLRLHTDYKPLADLNVTSIYVELSYDPNLMTVGEIGNEGLITEDWGILTHHHDEERAKIYAAMAGNYPLLQPGPQWTWYDILYVGFWINPEADEGDCNFLFVDHAKFNEGLPLACTDEGVFTVIRHAITGNVAQCSTGVPLGNTLMTLSWDVDLDGSIDSVQTTNTDENGDYGFYHLYGSTGEYCVVPSKEGTGTQTITSYDASLILRALVGVIDLDSCRYAAADITGDGTVTAYDASQLLTYVISGNAGLDQSSNNMTGQWIFLPREICYQSLSHDTTDQDFLGMLVGDVSMNWPGLFSPKLIDGGITVEVGSHTVSFTLPEPAYGLDFTLKNLGDSEPVGVEIEGAMFEWHNGENDFQLAAASQNTFSQITITFAKLSHVKADISAIADEGLLFTSTVKIVPLPTEFTLDQNYPNPFNPTTHIQYTISGREFRAQSGKQRAESGNEGTGSGPDAFRTTLLIYNMMGQEVRCLVDEVQEPGYYTATWDGCDERGVEVASGVYFYRLQSGEFASIRKMVLMK
ncbi:MAG: hypothetical protein JSV84_09670 [Gemmatimonadota bacterium]|nr:MAG: hypothetical protein JSV84_09670 [Gemmatimonadota bacterium]